MNLTDILNIGDWIEFEKHIHDRSGLDVNVFGIDGRRISDYKQWVNSLCPKIKADDRGQSFICAVAHMNIAELSKQAKKPVIEECDAGLLKLVVPIFVNEEFIGAVGACGLLLEDGEIDTFMLNKTIGMDEADIGSLSNDIKKLTWAEAEELGNYIQGRINEIIGVFTSKSAK